MDGERKPYVLWLTVMVSLLVSSILLPAVPGESGRDGGSRENPVSKEFLNTLSKQERAWLRDHPVIRVVQDPGWPPVEFINELGEPSGMSKDYLGLVEQRLGVRFELVGNLSWQEAYARLKRWEIDLTTSVTVTPERTEFWAFTKPYMKIPIVIATHANVTYIADMRELAGKEVAVVDGYAVNDWIPRDFPEIRLVRVKTAQEGLETLQRGEVFAYIDNLLIIGHYLAKMKVTNIKIAGQTPYVNAQSMAVRKDWAPLAGILQKALDSLSETERNDIYRRWLPIRYEHGFDYTLLWKALAVFLVILLALVVWNQRLAREIRYRKQAEAALQESETRYRLISENSADVIWLLDPISGKFLYVSPSVEKLRGYTPAEVMAQPVSEALTAESMKLVSEGLEEHLTRFIAKGSGNESFINQVDQPRKDGSIVHTEVTTSFVFNERGQVEIIGVTRDITGRKRAEEKLRENEKRYRELYDFLPIPVYEMDLETRITSANRAIYEAFRGSEEDLKKGIKAWQFLSPGEIEKSRQNIQRLLNGEQVEETEYTLMRLDGSLFPAMVISNVIFRDGQPVGLRGAIIDITDRQQAEEEKRSLEERLQRAEKMEALGLLAGGVAHDLNNVLGIVVGYAELLLNDLDEFSSMKDNLLNIMDGGQRAAAIVQDLLTLTRRGVAGRKILNLNRLILDYKKSPDWEKLFSYHPAVKIKTDLEPDLLNISGSPVHLEKSLFNLVSNASEAMPKGGTLAIKTTNQYLDKTIPGYDHIRGGDYVVLSVADSGQGISATDLKRIFEPFYTKKIMGRSGTGLGLAVVWGTVKDHSGYIDVESEEGKGTRFTLYFPVAREEITLEASSVSLSEYLGRGESILVVDDVKGQRELAAAMLKKLNYRVASVSSGEEAIEYLRKQAVDLLVLDMIMEPGMDGLDTYKSVLEIHPQQKAIIVSGFSESDRVESAQSLGAGVYVRKPYVLEKLGLAVRKELDRAK